MSDAKTLPTNQELQHLSEEILSIAEVVEDFPIVARVDATPRVHRLQVMEKALLRNVREASDSRECTGPPTAHDLYSELRRETSSLKHEIEFLDQGNPTTVSATGDVVMDAIESTANAVAKKVAGGVEAVQAQLAGKSA